MAYFKHAASSSLSLLTADIGGCELNLALRYIFLLQAASRLQAYLQTSKVGHSLTLMRTNFT